MANNTFLENGFMLGEYRIVRRLSGGGFSSVYQAYGPNGEVLAIKEFLPNSLHLRTSGSEIRFINSREEERFKDGLRAFMDETEIIMKLKHRNVIEILDFFEANGTAYIVMPFEYGLTLAKFISGYKGMLPEQEIVKIIRAICAAVNAFHERGIVHLDLKPGNIWMRPDKEALILDFGTARMVADKKKGAKQPMYTPGYAAPEQHREFFSPNRVGLWTDYYGIGTTMYALINRHAPESSALMLEGGARHCLLADRSCQYSAQLLRMAQTFLQLSWEERKKISLPKLIDEMDAMTFSERDNFFISFYGKNIREAMASVSGNW